MVTVSIVAMAATGILLPFTAGAAVRAEGEQITIASQLACDLMERACAVPFDQLIEYYGSEYQESEGNLYDAFGQQITATKFNKFSRTAKAAYTNLAGQDEQGGNFIIIEVAVFHNTNELVRIQRLRSR